MYKPQDAAEKIKKAAKEKGVSVRKILIDCELGPNAISQMSNGRDMLSKNIYKIAEYLDCSVDYLLGRDDKILVNSNIQITHNIEESSDNWRKLFSEFTVEELMKIMLILNETIQKKID